MLLRIAFILCFLCYYCTGQSANDILYTSNPVIESVTGPSASSTTRKTAAATVTTGASVTYSELNLFTSNPVLIESNDLPNVVPLLTNNTDQNTAAQNSTQAPTSTSTTLSPEADLVTPIVPFPFPIDPIAVSTTTLKPSQESDLVTPLVPFAFPIEPISEITTLQNSNESLTTADRLSQESDLVTPLIPFPLPLPVEPIFVADRNEPVDVPQTENPVTFTEPETPTIATEISLTSIAPSTESSPTSIVPSTESYPPTIDHGQTNHQLIQLAIASILPSSLTCGFQNDRTSSFDGSFANIDEFPWVVLLKYHYNQRYNAGYRCTGTLISRRYVMTAANCVVTEGKITGPMSAVLGEYKISASVDCVYGFNGKECADKAIEVPIEKYLLHPRYNCNQGNDNLGILRLHKYVEYTRFIAPICLPMQNLNLVRVGQILVTSGWGATENGVESDIKTRTDIPVLSNSQCSMMIYRDMYVFQNQVCVGTDFQKNICRADYGGPVMAADRIGKPQWYLEGVMSGGFGFGRMRIPNKYTRISPYVEWILTTMAADTYNSV